MTGVQTCALPIYETIPRSTAATDLGSIDNNEGSFGAIITDESPAVITDAAPAEDAFELLDTPESDLNIDLDLDVAEALDETTPRSTAATDLGSIDNNEGSFGAISDPWSSDDLPADDPAEDALDALDELWTEGQSEESVDEMPSAAVSSDATDFDEFADLDLVEESDSATDSASASPVPETDTSSDFDDFADLGLDVEPTGTVDLAAPAPTTELDELGFDAAATDTDLGDLFGSASDTSDSDTGDIDAALSAIASDDDAIDAELSDIFADTPTSDTAATEADLNLLLDETAASDLDVAAAASIEVEDDLGGLFDDEVAAADAEVADDSDLGELMGEAIAAESGLSLDFESAEAVSGDLTDLSLFDAGADSPSPVEPDDLADLALFNEGATAEGTSLDDAAAATPATDTDLDALDPIASNGDDLDALLNADDAATVDEVAMAFDGIVTDEGATAAADALDLNFAVADDNDLELDALNEPIDNRLSGPAAELGEASSDLTCDLSLEGDDAAIASSDEPDENSFFDTEPVSSAASPAVTAGVIPEDDIDAFFATPTATSEPAAASDEFDDFLSSPKATDATSDSDFLAVESTVSDEPDVTTAALDEGLDDELDALAAISESTDGIGELDLLTADNAEAFDLTTDDEPAAVDSLFEIDELDAATAESERSLAAADPVDVNGSMVLDDLEAGVDSADLFEVSSPDEADSAPLESSLSEADDLLSINDVIDERDGLETGLMEEADLGRDSSASSDAAEDLVGLDALLDDAPTDTAGAAGEETRLDALDALLEDAPAVSDAGEETNLDDLDALLEDAPTATNNTADFDGLDALLDDAPSVAETGTDEADFDSLDALLDDAPAGSQTAAGFDELDDLLGADAAHGLTAAGEGDVDFDELDALIGDDSPPKVTEASAANAAADDDFGDLEKLLEEADQALGGPSASIRSTGARRAPRRVGGIVDQTMRVSVKHLDNLNNLVGELVVNRNSLEQDQDRFRQFLDNLLFQVQQLNDVGQRMRDLYERSLLESSLLASRQAFQSGGLAPAPNKHGGNGDGHATGASFDALEMDRFTGFHTLTQEMIELIVRVRESSSDIAYTVESTDQIARQFRQVTTQLQEGLNKARMVPFAQTADRLPRAVRDISIKCGKEARLVVEGRDTLIDKMLLERLYDPMTHLVNNAITHGIESPEERAAVGKPREGKITVRAFYQGNQTVIYIEDDGGGINPDVVKSKAIQRGIITQADADSMDTLETYELLFRHGFSTRDRADDFAGRGVGMDVVRTALAEIRGSITIDSDIDRKSTRLNSSHSQQSRMPSSA